MARAKKPATMGDLIRSLVVILVPLVLVTLFFTRDVGDHPVTVVDWQPVAATARSEAPYPVLTPVNLPPGWRAVQATWVKTGEPYLNGEPSARNLWKLGFLTSDDVFIGLAQGDLQPDELVRDETREGVADGQSVVGDQTWERFVSPDGRTRSLVDREPKVTTVISADLPYEALDTYAGILSTSGS
ncbi:DUF4245 domain-containing protein [Microlunatus flavus]|nr:DUF4245 domain-containing protein [Microlunatus flavus]